MINPDDVKVEFSATSTAVQSWTKVSGVGACTSTGFYYDQTPNPTRIILCGEACTTARQASNPRIEVAVGCH